MAFDRNGIRLAGSEQAPPDALRLMLQTLIQETLERDFAQVVGAARHERSARAAAGAMDIGRGDSSRASARSSCACPAIAPASFAPSCSRAISGASRRW
jgi:hypothetical protein